MRTTGNNFLKGVVMFCFMCLVATATAQYSILNAGFEEGLPTGWAQQCGRMMPLLEMNCLQPRMKGQLTCYSS